MERFYSSAECERRANQHWEMVSLARQDRDNLDAHRHTTLARLWGERAAAGGWLSNEKLKEQK